MNNLNKILILFMLQFLVLTGMWAIDIGASGMIWESVYGTESQAQGLGFLRTANEQYHVGLAVVYSIFFIQLVWIVTSIIKSGEER